MYQRRLSVLSLHGDLAPTPVRLVLHKSAMQPVNALMNIMSIDYQNFAFKFENPLSYVFLRTPLDCHSLQHRFANESEQESISVD